MLKVQVRADVDNELRMLLKTIRMQARVIPGTLNPPHPAGAAPRQRHGPKPAAQHAERTKTADHRPGVESRRLASGSRQDKRSGSKQDAMAEDCVAT
jgi:hypothetical protein